MFTGRREREGGKAGSSEAEGDGTERGQAALAPAWDLEVGSGPDLPRAPVQVIVWAH